MKTLKSLLQKTLEGGSNSWVATCVGCAEGTRTANGRKTKAYFGHTDPGNGVNNIGSFSYQHTASDPEEADRKQIDKLAKVLMPKFIKIFEPIELTEKEYLVLWIVACDCFTQSEIACTDKGGFLELAEKGVKAKEESKMIPLWRTNSYFDPRTGKLDAPGFNNNINRLEEDQNRRTIAILAALGAHLN